MIYEEIDKEYIDEVNVSRIIELNYLNKSDIDVCKYVIKHIPNDINIENK